MKDGPSEPLFCPFCLVCLCRLDRTWSAVGVWGTTRFLLSLITFHLLPNYPAVYRKKARSHTSKADETRARLAGPEKQAEPRSKLPLIKSEPHQRNCPANCRLAAGPGSFGACYPAQSCKVASLVGPQPRRTPQPCRAPAS